MHISRMDLNLFVVFEAIYAEGGVTPASRRLNLSQPAVSHALGRLRQLLDDPLFERSGAAMTPTARARRIIEPVRAALRGFETTLEAETGFDPATARKRFVLAMRDAAQCEILPALLDTASAAGPDLDFGVVRAERRDLEKDLATGAVDLALDVPLPLSDAVRRQRLRPEGLCVLAREGHPSFDGTLTLEAYLAAEHVMVSSRRRGLSVEDFELARRDLRRRVRLRCQSHIAAFETLRATDLLLTMPSRHAAILNRGFGHRTAPFPIDVPGFETYLYWHETADRDPANAWLRAQVLAALGEPVESAA